MGPSSNVQESKFCVAAGNEPADTETTASAGGFPIKTDNLLGREAASLDGKYFCTSLLPA